MAPLRPFHLNMNRQSASPLEALPHEWSVEMCEGIGQIQVLEEDHRKILRLQIDQGCISLFRSLTVNLQANPLVSLEWSILTLPTEAGSGQSTGTAWYVVHEGAELGCRLSTNLSGGTSHFSGHVLGC